MTAFVGLGSLPPNWRYERAKWLLARQVRHPRAGDGVVTAFRDGQVTLRANRRIAGFTEAVQEIGYQGVRKGDLIVHSMDGFAGAIGVSDSDGKASPVVHAYKAVNDVDPRFIAYVLRSMASCGYIESLAKGIRERSTSFDAATLANLLIPCPPFDEQCRIANFLDIETSQVDHLVSIMSKSRDLLQDKRRALLMSSFPDRAYTIARLGYYLDLVTSGPRGWGEYVGSQGSPFFRSANLSRDTIEANIEGLALVEPPPSTAAEALRSKVRTGDVLIGITGANAGWVALADQRIAKANVSQHVCLARPGKMVVGRWLAYALSAPQVQELLLGSQYGGTKTQLSLGDIRDLVMPLPSISDQQAIIASIEDRIAVITAEQSFRDRQISLLAECRQALITAAVTGQMDVTTARGLALAGGAAV